MKPLATLMEPFAQQFRLAEGLMCDAHEHIVRRASDMRGYYADAAALAALISAGNDPPHYETFESPVPEQAGQVKYCISKLYPGLVGEECFMTKGHYHQVADTAEVYLCLCGQGGMMMKSADGQWRWQEFAPGRLVYVPPCWAHRSVNTGDEPLVSLCLYPGDAGHNYGDIKTEGFPRRVFRRRGQVVIE
jgi:glucose-6-phosphate isomerase, archaeal